MVWHQTQKRLGIASTIPRRVVRASSKESRRSAPLQRAPEVQLRVPSQCSEPQPIQIASKQPPPFVVKHAPGPLTPGRCVFALGRKRLHHTAGTRALTLERWQIKYPLRRPLLLSHKSNISSSTPPRSAPHLSAPQMQTPPPAAAAQSVRPMAESALPARSVPAALPTTAPVSTDAVHRARSPDPPAPR